MFLYPAPFVSVHCSYAEISARDAAVLSSLCTYPIRNIKLFSERYFLPCSVWLCLLIFFQKINPFRRQLTSIRLTDGYYFQIRLQHFFRPPFFDNNRFRIRKILQLRKKGIEKGRNTTIKQSYFAR